jgi:hypothetical protein
MNTPSAEALHELFAHRAIENLITLYCRAVDRQDLELLQSVYHADARDDHASFHGTAQEFALHVMAWLKDWFCTMHNVTHSNIKVQGDLAAAESYYLAYHAMRGDMTKIASYFGGEYAESCHKQGRLHDDHEFICGGRYIDRFEKRNGEWRIANREITVEWRHIRPSSRMPADGSLAEIVAPGKQDRSDAVYRFFDLSSK